MDSFYDVPRRAPVPTQVEKFFSTPVVPEVSMLCTARSSVNNYTSYNTWKIHQHPTETENVLTSGRENVIQASPHNFRNPIQFANPQNSSHFSRKQVRFESPVLQQRPSLTYEPFNTRKVDTQNYKNNPHFINDQFYENSDVPSRQTGSPLNGKTFEQMYMANVPNRQLDLSIIDLPSNSKIIEKPPVIVEEKEQAINSEVSTDLKCTNHNNKENEVSKTYQQFLETQKKVTKENKANPNDSVTDIFNYKRNKVFNSSKSSPKVEGASKKCSRNVKLKIKDGKSDIASKYTSPWASIDIGRQMMNIQSSAQQTPNYKLPINDIEIQNPKSPLCNRNQYNILSSCDYLESNFHQNRLQNIINHSPKCDNITQTSTENIMPQEDKVPTQVSKMSEKDSEPTNKDLLKIIAQQNEQLLILQKQVAMLLNKDQQNQPKQIEAAPQLPQRVNYEKCITSTQNENFRNPVQDINNTPRKRGLSKFSIDLMTSFEVAIRPQLNKQNFINYEPKIQEVTESESNATGSSSAVDKNDKTVVDSSLHFQEPVKVMEMCPSPEPSININMNDYDSSDDDEISASEIGATFYHNLMGQVNNILRKAQAQTKGDLAARDGVKNGAFSNKSRDKTMSRVKEATLKHLKNIGVTIGPMDCSDDSTCFENDSKDYTPTEISFAVKQLLMKYLPDEQLAKITYKQAQSVPVAKDENPGIIPARPEFSFASVQYMKKYNLIPSNNDIKPRGVEQVPKVPHTQKVEAPKILDITALKMQPKLL